VRVLAESVRRAQAQRFDTDTRQAIREEIEIATEMQKSEPDRKPMAQASRPEGSAPGHEWRRSTRNPR